MSTPLSELRIAQEVSTIDASSVTLSVVADDGISTVLIFERVFDTFPPDSVWGVILLETPSVFAGGGLTSFSTTLARPERRSWRFVHVEVTSVGGRVQRGRYIIYERIEQWIEPSATETPVSVPAGRLVIDSDGDWAYDEVLPRAGYVILDVDGDYAADAAAVSGFQLTRINGEVIAY